MNWPWPDFSEETQDDGPDVEQIREAVATGLVCSQCGECYPKPHGFRVACRFCFARMTEAEVKAEEVRLATHEESTAEAFRERARNKRKKKANG